MWPHIAECKHFSDAKRTEARRVCIDRKYKIVSEATSPVLLPYSAASGEHEEMGGIEPRPVCVFIHTDYARLFAHFSSSSRTSSVSSLSTRSLADLTLVNSSISASDVDRASFLSDLCSLFICMNAAWRGIEHPFVHKFFAKYMTVPTILPSANTLSGPILDQQYEQIVKGWRRSTVGRYGSLQSDGWKNKRKRHLVTTVVNVDHKVMPLLAH
jgi:hypothetical protein